MKPMATYITEYIVKKKLDKPIDSEHPYVPKTKQELIENIKELLNKGETDFSWIHTNKITDMSNLFKELNISTNIDISDWDVSNVVTMNYMFQDCENFDCDLSKWDVSNVLNMICMFSHCKNFKDKGLENWNVSKVKTMGGNMMNMLDGCKSIIKKPKWYRFKIK